MSDYVSAVKALQDTAKDVLEADRQGDVNLFLEKVGLYLDSFDAWKNEVEKVNPLDDSSSLSDAEREYLRAQIKELDVVHRAVVLRAVEIKDSVADTIGDVHKRAKVARAYIDQFPSRITIAGKRKG